MAKVLNSEHLRTNPASSPQDCKFEVLTTLWICLLRTVHKQKLKCSCYVYWVTVWGNSIVRQWMYCDLVQYIIQLILLTEWSVSAGHCTSNRCSKKNPRSRRKWENITGGLFDSYALLSEHEVNLPGCWPSIVLSHFWGARLSKCH